LRPSITACLTVAPFTHTVLTGKLHVVSEQDLPVNQLWQFYGMRGCNLLVTSHYDAMCDKSMRLSSMSMYDVRTFLWANHKALSEGFTVSSAAFNCFSM